MEIEQHVTYYQPTVITNTEYFEPEFVGNNQNDDYVFLGDVNNQENESSQNPIQVHRVLNEDEYIVVNTNTTSDITGISTQRIHLKSDEDDLLDTTDQVLVTGEPVYSENPKDMPIVPVSSVGKIMKIRHLRANYPDAYILYYVLFKDFQDFGCVINVFTSNNIDKIY